MVENPNHSIVPSCCFQDPWNSGLTGRSTNQTTIPVKMKKAPLASHKSFSKGSKKAQMPCFFFFSVRAPIPMSVKGNVNSTYEDLLEVIVKSPAAASYLSLCQTHTHSLPETYIYYMVLYWCFFAFLTNLSRE